ncbi:MAG: MarR family transcriptional regulator [Clostridiales bacterium]|nr:MarR family transcriptional regulator [Clostridiales bacterium]
MQLNDVIQNETVDFTGIESPYFLLGLLSAFDNRFQAIADRLIGEISWKQFFTIICINLCRENPTLQQLADVMGTSHQNCKQLLLKLEKKGFVSLETDPADRRRQRIRLTEHCLAFCQQNDERSQRLMQQMFAGIPEEHLRITIQTIIQMEQQLTALAAPPAPSTDTKPE